VEAAVVVAVVVAAAAEPWDPFGTLGAALWIGALLGEPLEGPDPEDRW
jgi:hypothetical protein